MPNPSEKRNAGSGPRPNHAFELSRKTNLATIKTHLEKASRKAYATGQPSEYAQVNILLVRFDDDNMDVGPLEDDLEETFKTEYKYHVRRMVLPGKRLVGAVKPKWEVTRVLIDMENEGALEEDCLVIVVFSGHGLNDKGRLEVGGQVFNGMFLGQTMYWKSAWALLFEAPCHVLQILDCCGAAEAAHPSVEMIAATSATETFSSSAEMCFARALNRQLRYMGSGAFSVSELVGAMMENRNVLGLDCYPFFTPHQDERSIILRKDFGSARSDEKINANHRNLNVVITARTEEILFHTDLSIFRTWMLTSIPRTVRKIQVSLGEWQDVEPTLLYINLPVELWLQLPHEDAYNFVAHVVVRSNLMQPPPAVSLS